MSLLQIKANIIKDLEKTNEKISKERTKYLDIYIKYLAVNLLRKISLIRTVGDEKFIQVEYDYKVWKSKQCLKVYTWGDLTALSIKCSVNPAKSRRSFYKEIIDILFINQNSYLKYENTEDIIILDSKRLDILRDCFINLNQTSFFSDDGSEAEYIEYIIKSLDTIREKSELYMIKNNSGSDVGTSKWQGISKEQKKIRML